MQRGRIACLVGLAMAAGLIFASATRAAAQADLIAAPEGTWTLITNESGPLVQWPGFDELVDDLGDQGEEALTGALRAWRSPSGEVVVIMIIDTTELTASGFVDGLLDGVSDIDQTGDCDVAPRLHVTVQCGVTEGLDTTIAVWESNTAAVALSTSDFTPEATSQMLDRQLDLVPAIASTSSGGNSGRLLGPIMVFVLIAVGAVVLLRKLSARSGAKTMVDEPPSDLSAPRLPYPPGHPASALSKSPGQPPATAATPGPAGTSLP